jgi:hypothetical protein
MYNYRLESWRGRLCNNLIQLTDAIYLAKKEGGAFEVKLQHSLIRNFNVNFNGPNPLPRKIYDMPFYNEEITLNERREILRKYILPNCRLPQLDPMDVLVIHMRGGDILRNTPPPHSCYVQPPISFYKRVIEDCPVKQIIIITEPVSNPCAKVIAFMYPNCKIQISSITEDVTTFLRATHVCFNIKGTFGKTLALMSPNIKHAYITQYNTPGETWNVEFKVNQYAISDTYIQPGQWTASDEQIALMLSS